MDCLLSCCCGPLLGPEDAADDLYARLGVSRLASADEIRRAHRRQSLQLHPDKVAQRGETVTREVRAKFQSIQTAYEVLRDPEKRRLYDRVGMLGIQLLEDPMSAQGELFQRFLRAPARFRLRFILIVFLIFAFLCLFPFLAAAEIDDAADLPWVAIATPLWIYNALGLVYHGYMLVLFRNPTDDSEEPQLVNVAFSTRLYSAFKFVLRVVQAVTLLLALDDDIDTSWGLVLLPLFIILFLHIGESLIAWSTPIERPPGAEDGDPEALLQLELSEDERRSALYSALEYGFFLLQALILVLRLDGVIGGSYWLLALPLFVYIVASVYLRIIRPQRQAMELLREETTSNQDELLSEGANFKAARSLIYTRNVSFYTSSLACQLLLLILILVRIEEATYSVYIIYLPILIPLSCFFFCLCLSILTVTPESMEEVMQEQHPEYRRAQRDVEEAEVLDERDPGDKADPETPSTAQAAGGATAAEEAKSTGEAKSAQQDVRDMLVVSQADIAVDLD